MSAKNRLFIFLTVVIVIGALVAWTVWLRPHTSPQATSVTQPQVLADQEYQQKVSDVLARLSTTPNDSWKQQLESALNDLQDLRVSSQVKYDHLLLFTALDIWKTDDFTEAKKSSVKKKLQTFASHQPWSQATIDSLITKGNLGNS